MALLRKVYAAFGEWPGIVFCGFIWPIVLIRVIDHTFTWYGGLMCMGFAWLLPRGAYLERQRKNREAQEQTDLRAENARLRAENEELRRNR